MRKILPKILLFAALVATVGSCSKDALRSYDAQQQLNAVENVNDPFLLSSITKNTSLFYQSLGWGDTRFPGAVQYTERNFQGGDNTYQGFRTPNDDLYSAVNILKLVDGAINLANNRGSKTHQGIFQTFRVLLFSFMTDLYGDIYYSEALKGREGILYPKYDKQSDIYAGLLKELDQANTLIASGTEPISDIYDLMYGGDKVKWQKFNNSLKLRLLMRASAKIGDAGAQMNAILSDPTNHPIFTDNKDNAAMPYIGTSSANSWVGGRLNWDYQEFDRRRPSKTFVDMLAGYNDPRLGIWFAPVERPWTTNKALDGVTFTTTDANGFSDESTWEYLDHANPIIEAQASNITDSDKVYVGFIPGMYGDFLFGNGHYDVNTAGIVGNYKVSRFSQQFRQNSGDYLRATIMNADEVEFILAEASAKGLIAGDANAHYKKAVTLAMQRWGVSDGDISNYLAQGSVSLSGSTQDKLATIANQKWLALFTVATEAYFDIRRTQLPNIFNNGLLNGRKFPLRFLYPSAESGQNRDAYDQGVQGLSPAVDDQYSKMWLLQ